MRVSLFVLTPLLVLDGYPASWITSFHLSPEKADFVNRLRPVSRPDRHRRRGHPASIAVSVARME